MTNYTDIMNFAQEMIMIIEHFRKLQCEGFHFNIIVDNSNNVVLYDENETSKILNYQQLIQYVENIIGKRLINQYKDELAILYETDKYFRDYIDLFKTKNIIRKSLFETEKRRI